MYRIVIFSLFFGTIIFLDQFVQAAQRIQAGLYQVTGITDNKVKINDKLCIDSNQMKAINGDARIGKLYTKKQEGCELLEYKVAGPKIFTAWTCSKISILETATYYGNRYEWTVAIYKNSIPISTTHGYSKRIGNCK